MKELSTIVKEGQKVLTTQQLAESYETEDKNIQMNFLNNKNRFIEGKHFFYLIGDELKEFKNSLPKEIREPLKFVPQLLLWTEKGCLHHAKMLNTDIAWNVYEELEETYFRIKENIIPKNLSKEIQAIFILDEKQMKLEKKVDDLENNMPLFSIDCDELQAAVRKKGIKVLGGKSSQAYKDNSLRGKIYSDIQREVKRQFGLQRSYKALKRKQKDAAIEIIEKYVAPIILQDEITLLNGQVAFV